MNVIPKWGPRLARLYSEDIRKLEAKHAGRLSPGASTWEQSIESLSKRVVEAGPRKAPGCSSGLPAISVASASRSAPSWCSPPAAPRATRIWC
jgi:hypothetical protein